MWGQPVLIPGSMGTASWVLRGVADNPAFATAAHGAGRLMSRSAAKKTRSGREVMRRPGGRRASRCARARCRCWPKRRRSPTRIVDEVVEVCRLAGLAAPVARLRPIGVVKG